MNSFIELFDLLSGNVMANYASEDEAWDDLRQWAEESGIEELQGLSLLRMETASRR
jgi:hypothetical protein